ncbi:MAG TPA: hypothetical protein VF014_14080, partial [Casimicrobiaceae bacterium]|nr:hypothetical protein [Casimicrobiaceae bacterium]
PVARNQSQCYGEALIERILRAIDHLDTTAQNPFEVDRRNEIGEGANGGWFMPVSINADTAA